MTPRATATINPDVRTTIPKNSPRKMDELRAAGMGVCFIVYQFMLVAVKEPGRRQPFKAEAARPAVPPLFLDRLASFFEVADLQALSQGRNLVWLDVAHHVYEHHVLRIHHGDDDA